VSICPTCNDQRFVTVREASRRYVGEGPGDVYPCPICGRFVFDGDGKKYGFSGKKYGNPNIENESDYLAWRSRNVRKSFGWHALSLMQNEERMADILRRDHPGAKSEWIKAWVLGERKVYGEEPDDPNYDPAKDPELAKEIAEDRKRRAKLFASQMDSMVHPEWWTRVQKGIDVDLNEFQQMIVQEYLRQKKVKDFLSEETK
jgi:hypothetical protein